MMVLEFVLGNLFIIYTVILHILSPGTFMDILTSFCNIWAVAGFCLIALSVYRVKHGHSLWSRLQKKWKKVILSFAGICTLIALVNMIFILTPKTVNLTQAENDAEFLTGRTFVFLLGGGIDKKGKLPKSVMNRVDKAAEYLNINEEAVCVVTGGTLKWLPYAEAPELKRQLVKRGVSPDRIFVEDQALDTIQNFQKGTAVFENELGISRQEILASPVIAVSNRYHLRRAQRLAKRMGFTNVSGIGAKTPLFYIPMAYLREICAYVKLNLRILLTGEPAKWMKND